MSLFQPNFDLEISQARDVISRLTLEREDATLAVVTDQPDAQKRLAQIEKDLADAASNIDKWERAKTARDRQEAQKVAASKAALRKTLVNSASSHLSLMANAAADLERHIEAASKAYATMCDQARKAIGVAQIAPVEWPPAVAEISEDSLARLTAGEMYRTAQPGPGGFFTPVGHALPGATPGHPDQKDDPTRPPRLGQIVHEAAEMLKAQLKMKLPK